MLKPVNRSVEETIERLTSSFTKSAEAKFRTRSKKKIDTYKINRSVDDSKPMWHVRAMPAPYETYRDPTPMAKSERMSDDEFESMH